MTPVNFSRRAGSIASFSYGGEVLHDIGVFDAEVLRQSAHLLHPH
jgi:hypothetical protein